MDVVTKTSKVGHVFTGPNRVLGQDQQTVVIQRKKRVERITADKIALTSEPADVSPIPPESPSTVDIHNKCDIVQDVVCTVSDRTATLTNETTVISYSPIDLMVTTAISNTPNYLIITEQLIIATLLHDFTSDTLRQFRCTN